jgi:regulator of protease activity HflC (stomatin/prohibitin superfamily)
LSLIAASVKQLSSQTDFASLYTERETISTRVNESVGKELLELYGVRLSDVIVEEPKVSEELRARYNNVKASEMDQAAARNAAESRKITIIAEAEARKEALRLDGEGIAAQRREIFSGYATQFNSLVQQGISPDHAQQIIMTAMTNDTLRDAAQHGNLILANSSLQENLQQMASVQKMISTEAPKPATGTGGGPRAPHHLR